MCMMRITKKIIKEVNNKENMYKKKEGRKNEKEKCVTLSLVYAVDNA